LLEKLTTVHDEGLQGFRVDQWVKLGSNQTLGLATD
jgi:hypothetical protein